MVTSLAERNSTYATLAEQAIREMILDGRLAPGERVNEVELAAALEISRGPLREAIQRLISQGLLTPRTYRGSYVRTFDEAELRQLYEVRIALETYAVRIAASRTGDDLRPVEDMLKEARRLLSGKKSGPYPSDLDFHAKIVALSGNPALIEAHENILRQIELARTRSASVPERARQALSEHEGVLERLAGSDPAGAAEAIEEHLWGSFHNAASVLKAEQQDH